MKNLTLKISSWIQTLSFLKGKSHNRAELRQLLLFSWLLLTDLLSRLPCTTGLEFPTANCVRAEICWTHPSTCFLKRARETVIRKPLTSQCFMAKNESSRNFQKLSFYKLRMGQLKANNKYMQFQRKNSRAALCAALASARLPYLSSLW